MTPRLMRTTSALVLVPFVALLLEPAPGWAQEPPGTEVGDAVATPTSILPSGLQAPHALPEANLEASWQRTLAVVREQLEGLTRQVSSGNGASEQETSPTEQSPRDSASSAHALEDRLQELSRLGDSERSALRATTQRVTLVGLPDIIRRRAQAAEQRASGQLLELSRLISELGEADAGKQGAALQELEGFLAKNSRGRTHTPLNRARLPLRSPTPPLRPMATAPPEARNAEGDRSTPAAGSTALAASGTLTTAASQPTPEDLTATEDVELTPEIHDLAESLGRNPVEIYNWVRSQVYFIPSWGSVKGAHLTLQSLRGNSIDIASLLIALLRAAGIPARYVRGTVEVPVGAVMNWVGGARTPEAALDLLGQAGVPVTGITSGGRVQSVRLEHVWVEAFVDFDPSRGAANRSPDSWIPMDASFKQYEFSAGQNLASNVPFDAEALLEAVRRNTEVNEAEGWARSVDLSAVDGALADYQERLSSFIDSLNDDPTEADVFALPSIAGDDSVVLAGTLPYRKISEGARMAVLPAGLRHQVTVRLYASELDKAAGAASLTYPISLPALNTKRLGVTYVPATAADAAVIEDAKARGATSLPAYLIELVPVLQLDGTEVARGPSVGMGESQYWEIELRDPGAVADETLVFSQIAGDEIVFAVNGNGIEPQAVVDRMERVLNDNASENLHQVALNYWMEHDSLDHFFALQLGILTTRLPSIAVSSAPLAVQYFFGLPRSASYSGRLFDAKRILSAVGAPAAMLATAFRRQSGIQGSYLEASIFNQLFRRPQGRAVSAVQLLADANAQGIPIHTIDQSNSATSLPLLELSAEVRADVEAAIAAGMVVTLPRRPPLRDDFTGVGYVIIDPQTGAGAYRIAGGSNGGCQKGCGASLAPPVAAFVAPGIPPAISPMIDTAGRVAVRQIVAQVVARVALHGAMLLVFNPVLAGVVIAVTVSIVILMAIRLMQLEAQERVEARSDEKDCECLDPKPPECECRVQQVPEKGGNPVHNVCKNQPRYNAFPGKDTAVATPGGVFVGFDAAQAGAGGGPTRVYEMKTNNCSRPGRRGSWCRTWHWRNDGRAQIIKQATIARLCNLAYTVVVGDPQVKSIIDSWNIAGVTVQLDTTGLCLQP